MTKGTKIMFTFVINILSLSIFLHRLTFLRIKNNLKMCKKGSKLNSIVHGTCPRCQKDNMYKSKNSFNIFTATIMNEKCANCGLRYMIEPAFFYGAMYVSYGVGIAFGFAAFIITKLLLETSLMTSFIAIVATLIVFYGIIMRISRNIWINIFVSYKPEARGENIEE